MDRISALISVSYSFVVPFCKIINFLVIIIVLKYLSNLESSSGDREIVQAAAKGGFDQVESMIELEKRLLSKGLYANKKIKSSRFNIAKPQPNESSREKSLHAIRVIEASKILKER